MTPDEQELFTRIGNKIAYYRKHKGMSQRNVADVLDVDESYISKVETAKNGISIPMLFAIANAIGIPAYKLIDFRDIEDL